MNNLPETGLLRLSQIINTPSAKKAGRTPLVPVSNTTWWVGVKAGRFPKPIYLGESSFPFWRVQDIRELIDRAVGSAHRCRRVRPPDAGR